VFLGPTGDTAQFLADALAPGVPSTDDEFAAVATAAVEARLTAGQRVPGLGHPLHKAGDPRTARLYQLAAERGTLGPHLRLLQFVADVHATKTGKQLPVNGAGAGGAALADMGIPPASARGFVLIARTAGLVAHLVEESQHSIGMPLYLEVERRASDS
jgi:citrate synthase